jgi:Ca2+-binding EF-hand superfamily protein
MIRSPSREQAVKRSRPSLIALGLSTSLLDVVTADRFARLDTKQQGFLGKEQLKPVAERMLRNRGQSISSVAVEELTEELFVNLDVNHDNRLSKEEFAVIAEVVAKEEAKQVWDYIPDAMLETALQYGLTRKILLEMINCKFVDFRNQTTLFVDVSSILPLTRKLAAHQYPDQTLSEEKLQQMASDLITSLDVNEDGLLDKYEFARIAVHIGTQEARNILEKVSEELVTEALAETGFDRKELICDINRRYHVLDEFKLPKGYLNQADLQHLEATSAPLSHTASHLAEAKIRDVVAGLTFTNGRLLKADFAHLAILVAIQESKAEKRALQGRLAHSKR